VPDLCGDVSHNRESTKGKTMNGNNRVLSRQNARDLTPDEVDRITGAINTLTICSYDPYHQVHDCDVNDR
jgi:hypothetical protein